MKNLERICLYCCLEKGRSGGCEFCGPDARGKNIEPHPMYIPPGTLLRNNQYLFGRELGIGGFGITYLALDLHLNMRVAIKEHFPRDLASRSPDSVTIVPFRDKAESDFVYGLEKFKEEGQSLGQFCDHPNVVTVHSFFEANGTGYLVMGYLEGWSLDNHIKIRGGRVSEEEARRISTMILDGLRAVHAVGLLHRDIKPQNIFITKNGLAKLIDFGSARHDMNRHSQLLSKIVSDGYSPIEQYLSSGQEGVFTDVYSTGVTIYHMLSGIKPPSATDRKNHDNLKPLNYIHEINVSPQIAEVVQRATAIDAPYRYQTVDHMLYELLNGPQGPYITQQVANYGGQASSGSTSEPPISGPPISGPPISGPQTGYGSVISGPPISSRSITGNSKQSSLWMKLGIMSLVFSIVAIVGYLAVNHFVDPDPSPNPTPIHTKTPKLKANLVPTPPVIPKGMVKVAGGSFWMGCPGPAQCNSNILEGRNVTVKEFYIHKNEVTVAEYKACVDAGECIRAPSATELKEKGCNWNKSGKNNHPMNCITYDLAKSFCLSNDWRLPTQIEWERAARGDDRRKYPWGDGKPSCSHAAKSGCVKETMAVGSKPDGKSPYGVNDMAGNVYEWTEERHVRGGGFRSSNEKIHISRTLPIKPSSAGEDLGFRCVANVK